MIDINWLEAQLEAGNYIDMGYTKGTFYAPPRHSLLLSANHPTGSIPIMVKDDLLVRILGVTAYQRQEIIKSCQWVLDPQRNMFAAEGRRAITIGQVFLRLYPRTDLAELIWDSQPSVFGLQFNLCLPDEDVLKLQRLLEAL